MNRTIIFLLLLSFCSFLTAQSLYIGIYISDMDKATQAKLKLNGGVRIDSVMANSPAQKAGLKKNQVIIKIDNHLINNESDFQKALQHYKANDRILFTVKHHQKTQVYSINTQNRDNLIKDLYLYNYIQNPWLFIGIDVQAMNEQLYDYFKVKNGVLIIDIRDHSIALKNDLKVGDIITHVNNHPVNNEDQLTKQLAQGLRNQPIVLNIIRKSKHVKIALDLTNKKLNNLKANPDEVYIIGPDIYDSELYGYSQSKINQVLKQSDSEIESEIERLESEIQGLKKRVKKK